MKKIYKYQLGIDNSIELLLPSQSQILSIQVQNGQICLWAMVEPTEPIEIRKFLIFGTGHQIFESKDSIHFLATVQLNGFVWHIFEQL